MATRYLIGKGELLTQPIDAPRMKPSPKVRPYSVSEAQQLLIPQLATANSVFAALPPEACPEDLVVARMALHPAFLAKSFFPKALLDQVGLASVGSRTIRLQPRRVTSRKGAGADGNAMVETTEIYVAGQRAAMRRFGVYAQGLAEDSTTGQQFAEFEMIAAMQPVDRIREAQVGSGRVFEGVPPAGVRDLILSVRYVHEVQEVDSWGRAFQKRRSGSWLS